MLNANDNEPVLNNNEFKDGKITVSLDENKTYLVIDLNSADDDLDPVAIQILAGKDAEHFSINNNKIVEFIKIPDFDNPKDSDADNTYEFDLQITDQKYTQVVPVFVYVQNINDLEPVWITKGGHYSILKTVVLPSILMHQTTFRILLSLPWIRLLLIINSLISINRVGN